MLEDELREMLVARAASAPAFADPAIEALRRGRAARRRRLVGTSVAATVALVCVLTLAVLLQSRLPSARGVTPIGPGRPTAASKLSAVEPPGPRAVPDTGVPADLLAGDQLWTADGQLLTLSGVASITRAYRVPAGWVYGGADQVRLMRSSGSSVGLSGQGHTWTLSPDGTAVAFVVDHTLFVGHVGTAGLAVTGSVDLGGAGVPVAFVGRRVLVERPGGVETSGRRHELVDPARPGALWSVDLAAVYGTRGAEILALARTGDGLCLVAVRSSDGTTARHGGCGLALTPEAVLGPDGARLAVRAAGNVRILDVAELLRGRSGVVADCQLPGDGPLAWADRSTVLAGAGDTVVRCAATADRGVVRLPPPIGAGWRFVAAPTTG